MINPPQKVYRGKAKTVEVLGDGTAVLYFRDDISAGDGAKTDTLKGKGKINCEMTVKLFSLLENAGIPTHMIEVIDESKIRAKELEIIPVEVVVRNIAAGSFCRRYGVEEGLDLSEPLVEFFVKNDQLHDPLIGKNAIYSLGYASPLEVSIMEAMVLKVNKILRPYFLKAGMLLVDYKIEVGKDKEGRLYLADELSADSMRVWDVQTRKKLDKDRFRKDMGEVTESYVEIMNRLNSVEYNPTVQPLSIRILITPKRDVPNPAGDVVRRSLVNLGLNAISKVSVGKIIDITFSSETLEPNWVHKIHDACNALLANPLVEDFTIDVSM